MKGVRKHREIVGRVILAIGVLSTPAWAAEGASPTTQPAARTHSDICHICQAKERINKATDWLSVGADFRHRMYFEENIKLDDTHPGTTNRFWHRNRARVWADLTPFKDLTIRTRVAYEPRYWCRPDKPVQFTHNEGIVDQLYVRWARALGMPVTITAGRQDMKLGSGWLIHDGTPLDGGRSFFFDAIRATAKLDSMKTTVDLVYVNQYSDSAKYIRPFNDDNVHLVEHDEKGVILYVSNRSVPHTTIDGYFIYKHNDRVLAKPRGRNADIYTFGSRVAGKAGRHWEYRAELAGQFGQKDGENICALGGNHRVTYAVGDAWATKVHFDYEYRGGSSNPNRGFDILWGRYTQWSNLYNYYISTLDGLKAMSGNLHRFGPGVSCKPTKKLAVGLSYHALFRDHRADGNVAGYCDNGPFRGHMLTGVARYNLNEHVTLRVLWDLFLPGNYYDHTRNDVANFVQTQLFFRW